ncbi:MAG: cytochrome P450 [Streptosporangiaceae bacterium]
MPITTRAPGPRGLELARLIFKFQRDPLTSMVEVADRYGDVTRAEVAGQTVFLLRGPEAAAEVLVADQASYVKGGHNHVVMRELLGDGLLTSNGDVWARHRRLVQPVFAGRRLGGFAGHMTAAAAQTLQSWSPGPLAVDAAMNALTLDVVGRALFGVDMREDAARVGRAMAYAARIAAQTGRSPMLLGLSRIQWLGPEGAWRMQLLRRARLGPRVAELNRVMDGMIDRRDPAAASEDLVGLLLAARDPETGQAFARHEVRDQIMTFLLAGHETTSAALTWMWYLLARHPEARARVYEEVQDVLSGRTPEAADVDKLTWTTAVIEETLRLYPPVWIVDRFSVADTTVGGHHVPAGSIMLIPPYLNHHDATRWQDPERFDPTRFLPEHAEDRPRLAYLPFGYGPRVCMGGRFALMEAVLITAMIAQRFILDLEPDREFRPEPNVTLRPRGGLPMVLRPASRFLSP